MLRNKSFGKVKLDSVEHSLATYRATKLRQIKANQINNQLFSFFNIIRGILSYPLRYILPELDYHNKEADLNEAQRYKDCNNKGIDSTLVDELRSSKPAQSEEFIEVDADEDISISSIFKKYAFIDWIILVLKCILWLILWKIFIIMEFGAVFFVISCFGFMWINLNTGKRKNSLSAYSVFNPNCEQITGSFTAEKFEKEILRR